MKPKRPIKLADTLTPAGRNSIKRSCKRCGYDISTLERCPECGWHWRLSIFYFFYGMKKLSNDGNKRPCRFIDTRNDAVRQREHE